MAIALGFTVLTWPSATLAIVVLAFAVYAIAEGIASLIAAIRGWGHGENPILLLLEAAIGIGVGIITLRTPLITAKALVLLIAVWALVTGVLRIVEGVRLRREISGEAWLIFGGIASILFALLILFRPLVGAFAIIRVLGFYALFLGFTEIMLSFRLRSAAPLIHDRLDPHTDHPFFNLRRKELHH